MKGQKRAGRPEEAHWGKLMAAAQNGDSAAYNQLLGEVLPGLRAFVRSRLSDTSAMEDVVQTVLMSIHQARQTYRPERPFGPWMRTIARNAVIDAYRARGVRLRREVSMDDMDRLEPQVEPVEPVEPLSGELTRALDQLPASQREAVELLHLQEHSVAEAAESVGIRPGALRVRAHRGYKALRAMLKGSGYDR